MSEERIVAIRVSMPDELRAKFKAQCALESTSMNDVVVDLIQEWLKGKQEGRP
jgi:hypothetical protein